MVHKKLLLFSIMVIFSLSLTGCGNTATVDTSEIDGGVFKSADGGNTWQQRALIPTTTGKPLKFTGVNVSTLVMDPGNEKTIYYGSIGNGLLYTQDGGGSWLQVTSLQKTTILAVAIDPKTACTVYAAIGSKIYKTTDCNRKWVSIYEDTDQKIFINSIAVDYYANNVLYFGNSRGDVIKSVNGGESWETIHRFGSRIQEIILNPTDSRTLYVILVGKGISRSTDSGVTWDDDIGLSLKTFKLGQEVRALAFVKSEPKMIFAATKYGLIRSSDAGNTWEQITLIPPDQNANINALAVNPQNSKDIIYTTNTTFFRSTDSGKTWATIKLPTSRAGWKLLIDPKQPTVIYMGVRSVK